MPIIASNPLPKSSMLHGSGVVAGALGLKPLSERKDAPDTRPGGTDGTFSVYLDITGAANGTTLELFWVKFCRFCNRASCLLNWVYSYPAA